MSQTGMGADRRRLAYVGNIIFFVLAFCFEAKNKPFFQPTIICNYFLHRIFAISNIIYADVMQEQQCN
jgi:hypothetical protein